MASFALCGGVSGMPQTASAAWAFESPVTCGKDALCKVIACQGKSFVLVSGCERNSEDYSLLLVWW